MIDAKARRDFIRGLVPDLKEEVKRLRATGEYVASGVLHNQRKDFVASLKADHKKEVVSLQKMFEKNYGDVRSAEETFSRSALGGFTTRWSVTGTSKSSIWRGSSRRRSRCS